MPSAECQPQQLSRDKSTHRPSAPSDQRAACARENERHQRGTISLTACNVLVYIECLQKIEDKSADGRIRARGSQISHDRPQSPWSLVSRCSSAVSTPAPDVYIARWCLHAVEACE
jgi:hypothetical protein